VKPHLLLLLQALLAAHVQLRPAPLAALLPGIWFLLAASIASCIFMLYHHHLSLHFNFLPTSCLLCPTPAPDAPLPLLYVCHQLSKLLLQLLVLLLKLLLLRLLRCCLGPLQLLC
jgi:hypothetical protein